MTLTLYSTPASPPVRGVLLTIHALGLQDKVKIVSVDMMKKQHLKPEFIVKNPLHTIPTLEDGDFVLWDSHAINAYLVNKYAKNDDLYPKDPKKRGLVDAMNHFDTGYLFRYGVEYGRSFVTPEDYPEKDKLKTKVAESLELLEVILERRSYVAGDQLTIADLSIVAIITSIELLMPLKKIKHQKIIAWIEKMKALPYYHVNEEGLEAVKEFIKTANIAHK